MIVTADDFGLSDDVNSAIVEAFARSLITHTSVMANMPGFEGACALAQERGLVDRIGVHLVLTEGEPLTGPIGECERFCDESGRFRYWRRDDHLLRLSGSEGRAVSRELREQVVRCRERGFPIAHLDSHHHVHTKHALGPIVIELAQEFAVPRVRLAHNAGARMGAANRLYKIWYNRRLRRAGLAGTRWLGGAEDYLRMKRAGTAADELDDFEVVTHPVWRDGRLVDPVAPGRPFEDLLT